MNTFKDRPMRRSLRAAALCVCWAAAIGGSTSTWAEDRLAPVAQADPTQTYHVEVVVEAAGELSFKERSEIKTLPTSVSARMSYDEKQRPKDSLGAAVRLYQTARAVIQVDKKPSSPQLRDDRNLVVTEPTEARPLVFSPLASLSAVELDLLQVPFTSLLVDRLLPNKEVGVGDQWAHDETLAAGLLNLDAVSKSELKSTLSTIDDGAARVELQGSVQGALGGVAAEFEIEGRYKFDRTTKRVTWIAAILKEKRSIGHIEPGVTATTKLQMTIAPAATPRDLADTALAEIDLSAQPDHLLLDYASPTGQFALRHERRWHVMTDAREVLSLRLVDRGELVAQCNVRTVLLPDPTKRPTPSQFQADVRRSIDKHFRQFVRVTESENSLGHTIFRAEAVGEVEDLEIHWIYYLVQDKEGRQAVFAFTCEQPMLERLGEADERLIESIRFLGEAVTVGVPTLAPERR
jgi:hypothetical protein